MKKKIIMAGILSAALSVGTVSEASYMEGADWEDFGVGFSDAVIEPESHEWIWQDQDFNDWNDSQNNIKEKNIEVSEITIETDGKVSEKEVKDLLPELSNSTVRLNTVTKQMQMVNNTGTMKVTADFKPNANGTYAVIVHVLDFANDMVGVGIDNNGNRYTGNWRNKVSYTNNDLSKKGDVLNISYVTALVGGHTNDVINTDISYQIPLPKQSGSIYFTANRTKLKMDDLQASGVNLIANGEATKLGAHYQYNISLSPARKQVLDFGFDYKNYNGEQYEKEYYAPMGDFDFKENLLSLRYADVIRSHNQLIQFNAGIIRNIGGNEEDYQVYRSNADKNFTIFRSGVNYQYRTKNNWVGLIKLNAQYTKNNLLSTEQLGVGGNYVRGFKERVTSGDNGYVSSFEIYTPEFSKNQRFVFFTDMGRIYNNEDVWGEHGRTISSVGVGYRLYNDKGLPTISIDYARPMQSDDIDMNKFDRRWCIYVNQEF